MKTKLLSLVVALSCAPLVVAGDVAAYPKENVAVFVVEKLDLTSLPSEEGKRKENICRLQIHDADGQRKRSGHRGGWWSEEVGNQGSRTKIVGNLRVCCGSRRKRQPSKDAKCNSSEKEGFERVVKGSRVLSRICCVSCDWRK
jgi:hypothetical protein